MADAKKCDRCEKFYLNNKHQFRDVVEGAMMWHLSICIFSSRGTGQSDLCEPCTAVILDTHAD
jgi:hypothetical protein